MVAPAAALGQLPSPQWGRPTQTPRSVAAVHSPDKRQARSSRMSVTITAVAAEAPVTHRLNTYTAADMNEIELQRCIARPRIDFESILATVRLEAHADPDLINTPPPPPRPNHLAATPTLAGSCMFCCTVTWLDKLAGVPDR